MKTLTSDGNNSETRKGAPHDRTAPDPRMLAFVRMLARQAADRDYARLLETHGKAREPITRKD